MQYMGQLLHPDVTDLIDKYIGAIMDLYNVYCNLDAEFGWEVDWEDEDDVSSRDGLLFEKNN